VRLESYLERLADGRASWSIGPATPAPDPLAPPPPLPRVEQLLVNAGVLHYHDVPREMQAEIRLSLADGAAPAAGQSLRVDAVGQWHGLPMQALLNASGALPWAVDETNAQPMPVTLQAKVGSAALDFRGTAVDALRLGRLTGQFTLQGSSLAAAGDPMGVTLPSTGPFRIAGEVIKRGADWRVLVAAATVGASRLNGAFLYNGGRPVPLLSGRLGGSRLGLVDLGPALGLVAAGAASAAHPDRTAQGHAQPARSGRPHRAGNVFWPAAAGRPRQHRALVDQPALGRPAGRTLDRAGP
jgi:uncharacterized protein involved in outer membrane biogenesis